ncbi:poly-gamma-glutamate hydrolase family protein [Methylotenera sp. 1P/1]|uniref:poly-gamma-glutamate hydrolase family protein n=1 Tax=Methylotenera sp. 1P/1 TaxID=1131551 RepID=UPI000365BF24|nr:poly-gamma-glutamate hydrolase family protein [Methylotenera sp. 1P/1]
MKQDKYKTFAELAFNEPPEAYKIELQHRNTRTAFIAPHGGKIEPGTSEICKQLAGEYYSYYLFEGCKSANNRDLHVTSSNFDEPQALEFAKSAELIVTVHGLAGDEMLVEVGGLAVLYAKDLIDSLNLNGFNALRPTNTLTGTDRDNICNKGQSGKGLQLEISRGLRDQLCSDPKIMQMFSSIVLAVLPQ